ncbi:MAG: TPR end-of-group domain-containing protein [Rhabdochlamydiaceae bacterium]
MVTRPSSPSLVFSASNDRLEECATILQEEGEKALLQGDGKGLDLLEKAAQLDPSSPRLFFRQGLALFEYGSHQNCVATLRKGVLKFNQATSLNPKFSEAWHAGANTQMLIASLTGKCEELIKAKNKIEQAILLSENKLAFEVYWDGALIYQKLADVSGEIDDLYTAIAYFEKSVGYGEIMPHEFWDNFGQAYATLSERLQDIRPVIKSITCYKQAITLSLSNFEGWIGLGRSLKKLYQISHENDYYLQACDCFAAASQLKPELSEIWLENIEFMIESSRRKKESAKLRAAIEKCEQAATLFTPSLYLQSYWAEALALLGDWTNQIELIQEAERKINHVLELSRERPEKDNPLLINQYGKCLYSFARYYRDLDLYYQTIEEFQTSISIDRTQLTCWTWMGMTYAKIYECIDDMGSLEKALYFYNKALQIKNNPHFYYEIATLLIQLGEVNSNSESIDQAIHYLEYLLQAYTSIAFEHPEWFYQYGLALNIQGDIKDDPSLHRKALEAFVNVLMFNPSHPKIHHRIGIVYRHLGELLGEIDYFYRSLHHFTLASRHQQEDEALLIDWGLTWIHLAQSATDSLMEENSFREAEQKLMQAARLGSQLVYYQLACLYSEQGSLDLSIAYLHKSHAAKNLPPIEEIMDDDWLEEVRLSPRFQEFLALLNKS